MRILCFHYLKNFRDIIKEALNAKNSKNNLFKIDSKKTATERTGNRIQLFFRDLRITPKIGVERRSPAITGCFYGYTVGRGAIHAFSTSNTLNFYQQH